VKLLCLSVKAWINSPVTVCNDEFGFGQVAFGSTCGSRALVLDHCPASELTTSYDTASWSCTETVTIIFDGKPLSFPHVIHFTFARNNGTWMVAGRR
jgi:hypothetical protein